MERANKSAETARNLDLLISKLSEEEILNTRGLSCVRGGEGDGSDPIIIIPPKPV